jgi:hypothetical protein
MICKISKCGMSYVTMKFLQIENAVNPRELLKLNETEFLDQDLLHLDLFKPLASLLMRFMYHLSIMYFVSC